jgi:hypothetical protein
MFKIISGGQTGADFGGLLAAKQYGIPTGGMIPNGFLTENGFQPELAELGLVETKSDKYPQRTFDNVKNSDATIRFARNFQSAGEKLTLKAIHQYNKPYFDVDFDDSDPVDQVVNWIKEHNIQILNVAGNRESKAPGIQKFTEEYLVKVFKLLKS